MTAAPCAKRWPGSPRGWAATRACRNCRRRCRGEVFNDQERINTLLTRAHEDSRQICQHTRSTGSNMPKSRCLTVAERRRIEEKGKALLNDQRTFNNFNPASSR